ncbi:MAG TPA: PIN domain-containing protein [Polyangiaceae bacterium]|nr:PIN domain-containing protein [Polyangiaceae bacterium]
MKKLADTGLLVAAADSQDHHHPWAAAALRKHAPFHTCQAVVLETAWMLGSPIGVLTLLARGDLVIDPAFTFSTELPRLLELCRKYSDRPMDLADACLVRMTELTSRCKVWTVDREDFSAYRRHGRQTVPCEFPPDE